MAAETTPLLPCPFPACQSDDVAMVSGPSYSVYCLNCGATGPSELTETEAAALWNRRDTTAYDALRARAEKAEDDLRISELNHFYAQNRIDQHLTDLDEMNHRAKGYADERDELRAAVVEWAEADDATLSKGGESATWDRLTAAEVRLRALVGLEG